MIRSTRPSFPPHLARLLVCLVCAVLLHAGVAGAATTTAAVYKPETTAEYQAQLNAGQIQEVVINKRLRSMRITLKDGTHVLAKYPPKQEPATAAALKAKGVTVSVLKRAQAEKEVPKKAHKLRYIAGGVLIVVLIVVGIVLFVDRKRKAERD